MERVGARPPSGQRRELVDAWGAMTRARIVWQVVSAGALVGTMGLLAADFTGERRAESAASTSAHLEQHENEKNRASADLKARRQSYMPSYVGSSLAPVSSENWTMRGRVQSIDGAVISGATVCAASAGHSCCLPNDCTSSNAEGEFFLERVPHEPQGLTVSARGYVSQTLLVNPATDGSSHTLKLVPISAESAVVRGSVVDSTGGGISGAIVTLEGDPSLPSELAMSGNDGSFEVLASPGPVHVTARAEAYASVTRRVVAPANAVALMLDPASAIEGQVLVDLDGEPASGARVELNVVAGQPSRRRTVVSGRDGRFRIEALASGVFALRARSDTRCSGERQISLGLGETVRDTVLRLSPAASLHGIVTVASSPCTHGGSVTLYGSSSRQEEIGPDGAVTVEGIFPDDYELEIACSGGVPKHERIHIGDENVTRAWDLVASGTLQGLALRADGQPLEAASIRVDPIRLPAGADGALASPTSCGVTDESGKFTCEGLMPGDYDCLIEGRQRSIGRPVRVSLESGSTATVTLVADAMGAILARLPSGSGVASDTLPVFAQRRGANWPNRAESSGSLLQFRDLPLGVYDVYVGNLSARPGSSIEVTLEHDGQVVELELPKVRRLTVMGRVEDETGQPVADARVQLSTSIAETRSPIDLGAPALTDEHGQFAIDGVPEGAVRAVVTSALGSTELDELLPGADPVVLVIDGRGSSSLMRNDALDPKEEE